MTLATVMVSLALDRSNDARLELAGQLAEQFGAGVVGVAAAQFSPLSEDAHIRFAKTSDGAPLSGLSFRGMLERPTDKRADLAVALSEVGSGVYRGDAGAIARANGIW